MMKSGLVCDGEIYPGQLCERTAVAEWDSCGGHAQACWPCLVLIMGYDDALDMVDSITTAKRQGWPDNPYPDRDAAVQAMMGLT